jgi:hypothetical protein
MDCTDIHEAFREIYQRAIQQAREQTGEKLLSALATACRALEGMARVRMQPDAFDPVAASASRDEPWGNL